MNTMRGFGCDFLALSRWIPIGIADGRWLQLSYRPIEVVYTVDRIWLIYEEV